MTKIKTANHHWWPICVSKHWRDENGFINRIQPNEKLKGRVTIHNPKKDLPQQTVKSILKQAGLA